jgi:heme exporter protein C
MWFELLRPYRVMLASFRYISWLLSICYFLIALTLYLSTWVAPSDFQQGENYRIIYVHVPAAWMSLLIYIIITGSSILFLLTKHPILLLCSRTGWCPLCFVNSIYR